MVDDLCDRICYVNIKNIFWEIFNYKVIFIVNENDIVVVNEFKVGDNDNFVVYIVFVV